MSVSEFTKTPSTTYIWRTCTFHHTPPCRCMVKSLQSVPLQSTKPAKPPNPLIPHKTEKLKLWAIIEVPLYMDLNFHLEKLFSLE